MRTAKTKAKLDGQETETELYAENLELKNELNLEKALIDFRERLIRIETKVDIHNNYEKRIRGLEKTQYIMIGGFIVIEAILKFIK